MYKSCMYRYKLSPNKVHTTTSLSLSSVYLVQFFARLGYLAASLPLLAGLSLLHSCSRSLLGGELHCLLPHR